MKKSLIKDIAKIFLFLSIILLIIIRIVVTPFWGNPFKKFYFAVKTHLYLESKYENDSFDIKSINYDYKQGTAYYALVKSEEHNDIGTFRVDFLEGEEATVLKDNLQEKIISTLVEKFYSELGCELGYSDMYVSYSPLVNQLTLTVLSTYSENDLPAMYSFIEQIRKDSIETLLFYFKGSNKTTHFIFNSEQIESIKRSSDILKVCSPVIF